MSLPKYYAYYGVSGNGFISKIKSLTNPSSPPQVVNKNIEVDDNIVLPCAGDFTVSRKGLVLCITSQKFFPIASVSYGIALLKDIIEEFLFLDENIVVAVSYKPEDAVIVGDKQVVSRLLEKNINYKIIKEPNKIKGIQRSGVITKETLL